MQPISANVVAAPRNVPHELLARLYREIGVAAVAAALGVSDEATETDAVAMSVAPDLQAA